MSPPNMHGRPTAGELVDAVRAFLEELLSEPPPAPAHHQIRIAVHALEVVSRELALGPSQEEAHRARLGDLGFDDDSPLADAIRSGQLEDGPALRRVLREDTRDRLLVANPRWLPADGQ
jgi:hypothetical protein